MTRDAFWGIFARVDKWGCRRCRRPFPLPGTPPAHVEETIMHPTAIVTDAAVTRGGPPTALPATEGFRDQRRCDTVDPRIEYADPPVSRAHGPHFRVRICRRKCRQDDRPGKSRHFRTASGGANVESVAICLPDAYVNRRKTLLCAA